MHGNANGSAENTCVVVDHEAGKEIDQFARTSTKQLCNSGNYTFLLGTLKERFNFTRRFLICLELTTRTAVYP